MIKSYAADGVLVTAFSAWAQDTSSDTPVVTANRFQQLCKLCFMPTDVVTREDIQRWQSKDLNDVMRRLPRCGYFTEWRNGEEFLACSWHRIAACPGY